jgi:hypothetical protein
MQQCERNCFKKWQLNDDNVADLVDFDPGAGREDVSSRHG